MCRTRHPRGKAKLWPKHKRNIKEWKGDSKWKPKELPYQITKPRAERRSPRARLKK